MSRPRILIAGVGNIFLGDDGFGVEVAGRLAERDFPPEARVADFGIRGIDLAFELQEGYETVILVDAVPRGERPGSLYVIEPELKPSASNAEGSAKGAAENSAGDSAEGSPSSLVTASPGTPLDTHSMDPVKVLRFAQTLGGPLPRILLVGCEPTPLDADEMQIGLSRPVAAAIDEAVGLVESLVSRLLAEECETAVQ